MRNVKCIGTVFQIWNIAQTSKVGNFLQNYTKYVLYLLTWTHSPNILLSETGKTPEVIEVHAQREGMVWKIQREKNDRGRKIEINRINGEGLKTNKD